MRGFEISVLLIFLLGSVLCTNAAAYGNYDSLSLPIFNPPIDDQVQAIMNQTYIPSVATAVVRNDSIIWAKGYGEDTDLEKIYMTGSVTKTITATAFFQLYEQGLIELDDDVNDYLPFSLRHPNFTDSPITIRMLLLHTSGLCKDTDLYEYGMAEDAMFRLGMENPYDWLPYPYWIEEHLTPTGSLYTEDVWTQNAPGILRNYSNIGYNVLAYILHLTTGQPIWDYVQENIFDPLEMTCSGYNFSSFDSSQLALPYQYMLEIDTTSTGNKAYPHYNYLGYGSGAIRSNVYDLSRYLLIHMHKGVSNGVRILEEQTLDLMHQLQASWVTGSGGLVAWDGWGGTEGDIYGFHAKAYAIVDGNTTVPYAVITFDNQGHDDARDAAYNITRLLQRYVHQYDVLEEDLFPELTLIIAASVLVVAIVLLVLKKYSSR